jgi:hypothetical protein
MVIHTQLLIYESRVAQEPDHEAKGLAHSSKAESMETLTVMLG